MPPPEDSSDSPAEPVSSPRRGPLLPLLILVVFGVVVTVVILTGRPRLFVDPSKPGNVKQYEEIVGPAAPAPDKTAAFLESLRVIRTNDRVRVEFQGNSSVSSRLLNYTLHRVKGAGALKLPKGEFRLRYQGIGHGAFQADELDDYSARVKPRFFDLTDGRELATNEVAEVLSRQPRSMNFRGAFPKVRFLFGHRADEELKIIAYHLFDARTKASLSGGFSWGDQDGLAHVEMDVRRWHSGPVELAVDLAVAPVEMVEIPAKEGAVIRQPAWDLHLAAVTEGDSGTSGGSTSTNSFVEIRAKRTNDDRPEISFLFLGDPWAYQLPIEIEVIGKDGKPMQSSGRSSSGRYIMKSVRGEPGEVDHIRAKIYRDVRRVVFELPTIHGLPNENDGLKNLFDARIPHLRFKSQWEFRQAIEGLTQLRFGSPAPPFQPPAGYFPKEFHDVTPRDLLEEYLAYGTKPQDVAIDGEKRALILDETPIQKLIRQLKKLLGK